MGLKRIDYGTNSFAGNDLDVNVTGELQNDNLAPGNRTDFFLIVKAQGAAHNVDAAVVKWPFAGTVSIEPPGHIKPGGEAEFALTAFIGREIVGGVNFTVIKGKEREKE